MSLALHVNVDHVATLRQARGTRYPDPVEAALQAERAGADGITVHLREDRRHIQERDVRVLREVVRGTYNLEMAASEDGLRVALAVRPDHVTLVPERREERTTEGGLEVAGARASLAKVIAEGCSCAEVYARLDAVSAHLAAQVNARTGKETITADRVKPNDQLLDGFMLKPMNCPHHIKIFASQPHSYRDLPVRFAEFGTVYRWEQSGELNGMTRVRGFTQDDAHLFCTEDQVPAELIGCLALVKIVLTTLGMSDYRVRVGLRDPDSKKYTGDAANWDKAEAACRAAAQTLGVPFTEEPGEAAFYGPKIDFVIKDVIGREWQLGTVQVDYNLPVRFDLSYIGADNQPHRPVMIHRAPFGSMERFCGVLIEHFGGDFPAWLAPEQVRLVPISDKLNDYAAGLFAKLKAEGLRATLDGHSDKLGAKIRRAELDKVPYTLVIGQKEAEANSVSVRSRARGDEGVMPADAFVAKLKTEVTTRALPEKRKA